MWWRLPDDAPGSRAGLRGTSVAELPLYGIDRDFGHSVVVVEGEKAADALIGAGIAAVGTVTSATTTPSERVLADLAGKVVYLWPDADDVGRRHMERMAERLTSIAASVRWIEPGKRAKGWDAADAIAEGSAELAQELIREAVDASEFLLFGASDTSLVFPSRSSKGAVAMAVKVPKPDPGGLFVALTSAMTVAGLVRRGDRLRGAHRHRDTTIPIQIWTTSIARRLRTASPRSIGWACA